ncbi:hypothetical protein [Nitrobacter sp. JJSN]|uniref:hypothetical protein n=1 Tax=Nitrobacter sp. JJSN TaxID=3453033 RepID=UPI003F7699EB
MVLSLVFFGLLIILIPGNEAPPTTTAASATTQQSGDTSATTAAPDAQDDTIDHKRIAAMIDAMDDMGSDEQAIVVVDLLAYNDKCHPLDKTTLSFATALSENASDYDYALWTRMEQKRLKGMENGALFCVHIEPTIDTFNRMVDSKLRCTGTGRSISRSC